MAMSHFDNWEHQGGVLCNQQFVALSFVKFKVSFLTCSVGPNFLALSMGLYKENTKGICLKLLGNSFKVYHDEIRGKN